MGWSRSAYWLGVMPMVASGVMVLSGALILADALRRRGAAHSLAETARFLVPPRLVLFTALMVAYGAAIPWAGFLAASAGFLLASMLLLWRAGPLRIALVTALSVAAIWVIFRVVFQVVLPRGALW